VYKDLSKWFSFIDITEKQGYSGLYIPPRCQPENCLWRDKYSVKMYSYTKATFPKIPSNILHWFSTNNDIDDPRITQIPFGISNETAPLLESVKWREEKLIDIYVNFQINTNERLQIQRHFSGISNAKVVKSPVSKEEYIEDLLNSRIVISPAGNGTSCYRTLESIYAGASVTIPENPSTPWVRAYRGLPVIITQNLSNFSAPTFTPQDLEMTNADLNFWRQELEKARKLLRQA
jgi:hypothetical protein